MPMETLALILIGLIIAGGLLFIGVIALLVSLFSHAKNRNAELAKLLRGIVLLFLAIPVGLFIYLSSANSQSRDTNDVWLVIVQAAPFILLGVLLLLVGAHVYVKLVNK
jgi:hypothetical protein